MRLLNKKSLKVEWFVENIPAFLILSHRWQGDETTLQEFSQRDPALESTSAGIKKILQFCKEVESRPEQYVWVDTCCIDKTNNTELQEAINSMYRWYEAAELCLVYLDDVDGSLDDMDLTEQLRASLWFTRGWTLQELLAPRHEVFVDRHWKPLGSREDLAKTLANITNIESACYGNSVNIRSQSVAKRLSWLSKRQTTRIEDLAYCVLGIFDVNMAMLYGEGRKAFIRLQKEIIANIDDESIFLWAPGEVDFGETVPILATTPTCFGICQDHSIEKDQFFDREPYRMTTKGLELQLYGERTLQFESEIPVYLNAVCDGRRAVFKIKRAGTHWQRLRADQIETVDLDSHPVPRSAWEVFEEKARELQWQGAGHGRGGMCQGAMALSDFEQEKIRFKVYIA